MKKIKKADIYAIIASVFCGIEGFRTLINYGISIDMILFVGMAITLFLKKEKCVIAFSMLECIHNLYYIMIYGAFYLFFRVIYFTLIAILLFLTLKKKSIVKKIWFIPAIVMFLEYLIVWGNVVSFLFEDLLWISVAIFLGLWVKEHNFVSANGESANNYSKLDSRAGDLAPLHNATIGEADMLKTYKELLETGIITLEEFEKKKKQIFE